MAGNGGQYAASIYGGVDGLMEETQDWIFKNQNQFATGFENWGSETPDWGTLDLSYFDTPDGTGSSNTNTSGHLAAYNAGMPYSYDRSAIPPSNPGGGGYGARFAGNG